MLDGAAIKFKLEWSDHIKIYCYHAFEPLVVATSLAVCLQIPSLTTLFYVLLIILTLLPLTLTSSVLKIKVKIFLNVLMLLLAVAFTTLKSYIFFAIGDQETTTDDKWELA